MLSPIQKSQVIRVVKDVMDKRIQVALQAKSFCEKPVEEKHKQIRKWVQFYGRVAYNSLKSKPVFDKSYKDVMAVFKENSQYYNLFKGE